jgi:hypothetical protein
MRRRERIALTTMIVVVGLLVAALLAADIIDSAKGCGSIDPTDPRNYSAVIILNDTGTRVVVDDCRGSYCGDTTRVDLSPGQPLNVHAACGVSGSQMTSWHVGSIDGLTLGYIAVQTKRKHDGLVYPVSAVSRDRQTPTPSR